jgi:hypothetical protein
MKVVFVEKFLYLSQVVFSNVRKVVRPWYASKRQSILRLPLGFETVSALKYLE